MTKTSWKSFQSITSHSFLVATTTSKIAVPDLVYNFGIPGHSLGGFIPVVFSRMFHTLLPITILLMATETAATHDRNKQNQIQGHHFLAFVLSNGRKSCYSLNLCLLLVFVCFFSFPLLDVIVLAPFACGYLPPTEHDQTHGCKLLGQTSGMCFLLLF